MYPRARVTRLSLRNVNCCFTFQSTPPPLLTSSLPRRAPINPITHNKGTTVVKRFTISLCICFRWQIRRPRSAGRLVIGGRAEGANVIPRLGKEKLSKRSRPASHARFILIFLSCNVVQKLSEKGTICGACDVSLGKARNHFIAILVHCELYLSFFSLQCDPKNCRRIMFGMQGNSA